MNNVALTWTELVHMQRWVSKPCSNVLGFCTDHQCLFSFSWKLCHIYGFCVFSTRTWGCLGRPMRRWVDNIRMDLQEVGCGYMDWIGRAQDRDRWWTLVSAVMNLRVPWNAGNFLTSCKPVSFSRRTLHHGVSKCIQHLPAVHQVAPFTHWMHFKSTVRKNYSWNHPE